MYPFSCLLVIIFHESCVFYGAVCVCVYRCAQMPFFFKKNTRSVSRASCSIFSSSLEISFTTLSYSLRNPGRKECWYVIVGFRYIVLSGLPFSTKLFFALLLRLPGVFRKESMIPLSWSTRKSWKDQSFGSQFRFFGYQHFSLRKRKVP